MYSLLYSFYKRSEYKHLFLTYLYIINKDVNEANMDIRGEIRVGVEEVVLIITGYWINQLYSLVPYRALFSPSVSCVAFSDLSKKLSI